MVRFFRVSFFMILLLLSGIQSGFAQVVGTIDALGNLSEAQLSLEYSRFVEKNMTPGSLTTSITWGQVPNSVGAEMLRLIKRYSFSLGNVFRVEIWDIQGLTLYSMIVKVIDASDLSISGWVWRTRGS